VNIYKITFCFFAIIEVAIWLVGLFLMLTGYHGRSPSEIGAAVAAATLLSGLAAILALGGYISYSKNT